MQQTTIVIENWVDMIPLTSKITMVLIAGKHVQFLWQNVCQ